MPCRSIRFLNLDIGKLSQYYEYYEDFNATSADRMEEAILYAIQLIGEMLCELEDDEVIKVV